VCVAFASWGVDLRFLGPPLRARASPVDSPSSSGSSPPSGLPRVATTRRPGARGRVRSGSLGVRSTAFGDLFSTHAPLRWLHRQFPLVSGSFRHVPEQIAARSRHAPAHCSFFFLVLFFGFFFVIRVLGVSRGFRVFFWFGLLCGFWGFPWA
jgi:hypothetical protein